MLIQPCGSGALGDIPAKPGVLIAIDFESFRSLDESLRVSLREKIIAGATCYMAGRLAREQYSLSPLAPVAFKLAPQAERTSHTFSGHPLLPAVLHGESAENFHNISVARGSSALAQPLMLARTDDGAIASPLFAVNLGAGVIICDLIAGSLKGAAVETTQRLLLRLLEDPASRLQIIGALVAFDRALGRDSARPVACDIVLDDRPVNFDYFNIRSLRNHLNYLEDRCPGIHIDFGWTPDQNRPSHGYVEAIKQFNAGFVWHGLLHHVDHRSIARPELHLARGQRLVEEISHRYQVRFQPVMVFPYEKESADCVTLLRREGFIAKAQTVDEACSDVAITRTDIRRSLQDSKETGFVTLARDSIETLSRDRMLARAALGMPIIIAAHPRNAGLRRFSEIRPVQHQGREFDAVLDFIAAKKLRSQSLEELARDQIAIAKDSPLPSSQGFALQEAAAAR